jgi:hypothetical protein
MSKAALGEVLELLQELPDSDQQVALQFLKSLKTRASQNIPPMRPSGSALQSVKGFLVFSGEVMEADKDWLKIVRDERGDDILRAGWRNSAGQ